MLLDMLVAVARKDYEDRRRQKQGQAKARAAGKYVGRPENSKRTAKIAAVFRARASYCAIQEAAGCGPATVAKIAKRPEGGQQGHLITNASILKGRPIRRPFRFGCALLRQPSYVLVAAALLWPYC